MRSDSGTSKRQEGISFLLFDMRTPGITVPPQLAVMTFATRTAQHIVANGARYFGA